MVFIHFFLSKTLLYDSYISMIYTCCILLNITFLSVQQNKTYCADLVLLFGSEKFRQFGSRAVVPDEERIFRITVE